MEWGGTHVCRALASRRSRRTTFCASSTCVVWVLCHEGETDAWVGVVCVITFFGPCWTLQTLEFDGEIESVAIDADDEEAGSQTHYRLVSVAEQGPAWQFPNNDWIWI